MDFITGVTAGYCTGTLSSRVGAKGLLKKGGIFLCIVIACLLDMAMSMHVFRGMVISAFAIIEAMSLVENIDRMGFGAYIPEFLRVRLKQIADEKLDVNSVIDQYIELRDHDTAPAVPARSASDFSYENPDEAIAKDNEDVLVIDRNLKGVDYSLAKCCHPIYGDPVFGFVTVNGGIKIHCENCPNAPELRKRFGYRIVKARWSGKGSSQYTISLRVIGNDDIGIVNNITSIISKEEKIAMRSINIDSNDGLFSGCLVVQLDDTSRLEQLLKKLRTVKGIKQITRL